MGESAVPANNVTLTPVYEGITFSGNYALGAGVKVSSTDHGGNKNNLVDGSHGLNGGSDIRWSSKSNEDASPAEADREWVQIDLGGIKSISTVALYPRIHGSYFPEAYEILVSTDGETWTKIVTVECDELAATGSTLARWHYFNSIDAQYVKVVATKMTDDNAAWGYIFQLAEIEIYGEVK